MNLAYRLAQGGVRKDLPASLAINPRLSAWLAFQDDGAIEVRSGKVEIGQGIRTALAQIAAEELCVPLDRVRLRSALTGLSPDEAVTSGSLSIQESGVALRLVCAEVREALIARAAERLGVSATELEARDGSIVHAGSGRAIAYGELAPNELLDREASGKSTPRSAGVHRVVGQSVPRLDLPRKVAGAPVYVHDMTLPGMLYGRVVRSPRAGAVAGEIDPAMLAKLPSDARVIRSGGFVGVVASREHTAVRAAERLRDAISWQGAPLPFESATVAEWIRTQPVETVVLERREATAGEPVQPLALTFTKPFIAHASLGPSCAVARWDGDTLEVWTHSQGIYNLRADLAIALRMSAERIVVQHVEGAGCYGHNGADDAALDAALLAREAGAPVQVVWTREQELSRSPMGPGMVVEVQAALNAEGRIVRWRHDVWSNGHSLRPGRADTPTLLAAAEMADGFAPRVAVNAALAAGGGSERNAIPFYTVPDIVVTNHRLLNMPVRTSALRSLGALGNVFAIESMMDELAEIAGMDAVEFRLRHLDHPRARRVLQTAAAEARWLERDGLSEGSGRGIAVAHYKNTGAYCAVAVDVEVAADVRVTRVVAAVDVGLAINPDGVRNQIEGGIVQAIGATLREQVVFSTDGVTSVDWEHYPILRFSDVPPIHVALVGDIADPPVGAGEAAQGPTAAAIANAVRQAIGLRILDLPLTRERIIAAMNLQGR
jgi:CO/xanthine dehydrogenase Mo-binding subunit